MTMDAIYEEHGSDWSHQVSAVGTTQLLQRDQILLSLQRVWLARLDQSMFKNCPTHFAAHLTHLTIRNLSHPYL